MAQSSQKARADLKACNADRKEASKLLRVEVKWAC